MQTGTSSPFGQHIQWGRGTSLGGTREALVQLESDPMFPVRRFEALGVGGFEGNIRFGFESGLFDDHRVEKTKVTTPLSDILGELWIRRGFCVLDDILDRFMRSIHLFNGHCEVSDLRFEQGNLRLVGRNLCLCFAQCLIIKPVMRIKISIRVQHYYLPQKDNWSRLCSHPAWWGWT